MAKMTTQEIKRLFRDYNKTKKKYNNVMMRIEELETKATKTTTNYEPQEGSTGVFNTSSKVEEYSIKVVELQEIADSYKQDLDLADSLLLKLKVYQRYLIKSCLIYHNSYDKMAEVTNTSARNIEKIVSKAVSKLAV